MSWSLKISIKTFIRLIILCLIFPELHLQDVTYLENYLNYYREFRTKLNQNNDEEIKYNLNPDRYFRIQKPLNTTIKFPCSLENPKSNPKPTNVNSLKPGDIDIIAAIGDSLTAGFGATATNAIDLFTENRGMTFLIGGQKTWREYLTLPNILKEYNPNLFGYSLSSSITTDRNSQFNVAEVGAISRDLPYMTNVLIKRILKDPRTNLNEDWKMISIFMGSNDFCTEMCHLKNPDDIVEEHKKNLLITLRLLRDNLPRTFINLIQAPDVSVLKSFSNPTTNCYILQRLFCPCFIGERFKNYHERFKNIVDKFRQVNEEIANYEQFDKNDFTIVLQPMLLTSELPRNKEGKPDESFFSVDCFHFSQKANALIAKAFWNNILEPIGEKTKTILINEFKCPTKLRPFIATKRNSL